MVLWGPLVAVGLAAGGSVAEGEPAVLSQVACTAPTCPGTDLYDPRFFVEFGNDLAVEPSNPPPRQPARTPRDLTPSVVKTDGTAYVDLSVLWGVKELKVCWINATLEDDPGRRRTYQAIRATWNSWGPIQFTGWDICPPLESTLGLPWIRIAIEDRAAGGPRASIGDGAATAEVGMYLNFTFQEWSASSCGPDGSYSWDNCVWSIAVHEFGHIMGLVDEHSRLYLPKAYHELTPAERNYHRDKCRERDVVSIPVYGVEGALLTVFDPDSVMNSCRDIYAEVELQLSDCDVAAIWAAYAKEWDEPVPGEVPACPFLPG